MRADSIVSFMRFKQRMNVGLAATGRADQRDDLVAADVETDFLNRVIVAVEHVDLARLHHGIRRREVADRAIPFVGRGFRRHGLDGRRRRPLGSRPLTRRCSVFLRRDSHRTPLCAQALLVAALETFSQQNRRGVHHEQEHQQHDDGGRRSLDERALGAVRPQINLHGQRRGRAQRRIRHVDDECHHADHQQRRRLAERARHADDRARQHARHRERQHVVQHHLHLRGAEPERGLADRRRHRRQRCARRDDDHRQRHQAQHETADERRRARQPEDVDEQRETEQAEHDRRHGREVVDVDLDEVGPAIARRELLEIDRRRDAERERQRQRHEQHEERADRRAPDAGELGIAGIAAREEVAVELQRRPGPAPRAPSSQRELPVVDAAIRSRERRAARAP